MGETMHVPVDGRSVPVRVVAPVFYDPEGERLNG
jgi:sarcosine oxidase subunit alpha